MLRIIEFIKKIFGKKDILQISSPKEDIIEKQRVENKNVERDFLVDLKQSANPSINDGNGFGIIKYINLKEII